jgi:hypothetical protein
MKLNLKKILSCVAFGLFLSAAACSNTAPSATGPTPTPSGDTQQSPSDPATSALSRSDFITKMMKSTTDLADQDFVMISKCNVLDGTLLTLSTTAVVGKSNSGADHACDDSNHFSAKFSVDTHFYAFVQQDYQNLPISGEYSVAYNDSDGGLQITITSNYFTYNNETYEFKVNADDVFQDQGGWEFSGTVTVNGQTCAVSSDGTFCK